MSRSADRPMRRSRPRSPSSRPIGRQRPGEADPSLPPAVARPQRPAAWLRSSYAHTCGDAEQALGCRAARGRLGRDGLERGEPPASGRHCDEGARGVGHRRAGLHAQPQRPRPRRRNDRLDRPRRVRPHELPVRRHRTRLAAPSAGEGLRRPGREQRQRRRAASRAPPRVRRRAGLRHRPRSHARCAREHRAAAQARAAGGHRQPRSGSHRCLSRARGQRAGGLHRDPSPDRPRGTANRHRRRAPRLPARLAAHRGCESRGEGARWIRRTRGGARRRPGDRGRRARQERGSRHSSPRTGPMRCWRSRTCSPWRS